MIAEQVNKAAKGLSTYFTTKVGFIMNLGNKQMCKIPMHWDLLSQNLEFAKTPGLRHDSTQWDLLMTPADWGLCQSFHKSLSLIGGHNDRLKVIWVARSGAGVTGRGPGCSTQHFHLLPGTGWTREGPGHLGKDRRTLWMLSGMEMPFAQQVLPGVFIVLTLLHGQSAGEKGGCVISHQFLVAGWK